MIKEFIENKGVTRCPTMYCRGVEPNRVKCKHVQENVIFSEPVDDLKRLATVKISSAFRMLRQSGEALASERQYARAWLTNYSQDLQRWCDSADLHIDAVVRRARELVQRPKKGFLKRHPGKMRIISEKRAKQLDLT